MRAVHVANTDGKRVYYLLDLEEGNDGAIVDRSGRVTYFNFWSFSSRKENLQTIKDTKFHKFFWSGHNGVDADVWAATFYEKIIEPKKELLATVPVVTQFPKPREAKMHEMADLALDFTTLAGSGFAEKAIGRALARRTGGGVARNATGGIRGFVRGAVFDANAVDADEDGWVQEGTQFARRATRKIRGQINSPKPPRKAQAGFSSLVLTPLKDRPVPPRFRVKRDTKMDTDIVSMSRTIAALDKMVADAFNDGAELRTVGDFKKAFFKAVPSFADGTSTADFLNGPDDQVLDDGVRDLANVFLLNAMNNKNWASVNWQIESRGNRLARRDKSQWEQEGVDISNTSLTDDQLWAIANREKQHVGAWAMWRPGTFLEKLGGFVTRRDKSRKAKIEISYRDLDDTLFTPDSSANDFTYAGRIFASLMAELNEGDIKSPEERSAIYQAAVRYTNRSLAVHELGHAAHYIASDRSGRKKILNSDNIDDPGLDAAAAVLGKEMAKAMSPEQRVRLLRRLKNDAAVGNMEIFAQIAYNQLLEEVAQDLQSATTVTEMIQAQAKMQGIVQALTSGMSAIQLAAGWGRAPMRDANGQRVKLNAAQAQYIQSVMRRVPGMPGAQVTSGDDFTIGHAMLLFGKSYQAAMPGDLNADIGLGVLPQLFNEHSRADWAGRQLIQAGEIPNPSFDPSQPPSQANPPSVVVHYNSSDVLEHFSDVGLPRLRSGNGQREQDPLSPEDTRALFDALFVHVGRAFDPIGRGAPGNPVDYLLNPPKNATATLPAQALGGIRERDVADVMKVLSNLDGASEADVLRVAELMMETMAYQNGKAYSAQAVQQGASRAGKQLGKISESLIQDLGHWDELSHDEINTAQNIAKRSAGGLYGNYMGHWTNGGSVGNALMATSAEFFAELTALSHMGQRLQVGDKLGNPEELTASEKAVLRKILAWLHPGVAFSLY